MSNNVPVLMLRGANGKFFPVAGITGGGGGGSVGDITAEDVSYTHAYESWVNAKEALDGYYTYLNAYGSSIDELAQTAHTHDNKSVLDKLSVANSKLQYNGSDVGLKPSQVTSGTSMTLADNTEYRLTDVTTLTLTYPAGDFECWMRLTFAASGAITVTLPSETKYIGTAPDFKNGETWELSIKDGVVVAGKVA